MELRQLKYFVTVAKTLSFSEASRQLYITQGTLSQQIQQLEGELGAKLFERSSHSVTLTEAGEEMLPLAKRTLEDSQECFQRIRDLKDGLSGMLSIGLTTSFRRIMTDALKSFIREYKGVKLNIIYDTVPGLMKKLRGHEIDFFLAFKPSAAEDGIEFIPLINSKLTAVMSRNHPLSDRKSLTMEELQRQRIVLPGAGLQARKVFDRYVNVDTSSLNICVQVNNPNSIIRLVRGTQLVAIMSSIAAYYDNNLVAIPIEGIERPMTGCIHVLKGAYLKKAAVTFIDMLRLAV